MKPDRPNILLIQADQLAARYLGAYGFAIASTPHIDSLAASGATLDSAYTNFPLCAPSRFSMMFDLAVDPREQTNQVDNPEDREVRDVLCGLIEHRWDNEKLTRDIVASQRRRRFLRATLAKGRPHDWDYRTADELERHCLCADKVYSQRAYQNILDYRFPEE
jgi:hypothetical protein